ncbi:hypothetical protein RGCCGE502_31552 (plasmid) [Rhizobium grahamii CCGE 502]|uniref:Uncharacterized protein n=2 Tax=Rhizobium grahamii TaxID=1120045 RepID=S3I3U9_9HYPH|nr:hypothetical protein RGCCGE502_31552 [Rhizobium grahamii CCGE 502]
MDQAGSGLKIFNVTAMAIIRPSANDGDFVADFDYAIAQVRFGPAVAIVLIETMSGFVQEKLAFELVSNLRKPRAMS